MFVIKSKKVVLWSLILSMSFFCFGFFLSFLSKEEAYASPYALTIVLDAGHGGIDGGTIGTKTNVKESELNLIYVNKLEKLFKSVGINIVKTRKDMESLAPNNSKNFKKEDMQKRKEIIEKSNAEIIISIHMNKFPLKSENGAQVFYYEKSETGKQLANAIRDELTRQIENARELTLGGDFFITKCSASPSVIVECGFLSNEQEEILLQQDAYQDKLCYSIFCGVLKYLGTFESV